MKSSSLELSSQSEHLSRIDDVGLLKSWLEGLPAPNRCSHLHQSVCNLHWRAGILTLFCPSWQPFLRCVVTATTFSALLSVRAYIELADTCLTRQDLTAACLKRK